MQVNENAELRALRRRVAVLESAVRAGLGALLNPVTMREKETVADEMRDALSPPRAD